MTALVTGAGSGIGRECARLLARRAASVVLVGRRRDALEETARIVEAEGGRAEIVSADLSIEPGIETLRRALEGKRIRTLVNAAGRESRGAFAEISREEVEDVLRTNFMAPMFVTQAALPHLEEGAGVVFVASVGALVGRRRHTLYGASKGALVSLVRGLAVELAPRVRVNCVCPGGTMTPMAMKVFEQMQREQAAPATTQLPARYVIGRMLEPEEVARTIVHAALDATGMTGSVIVLDGGYSVS